MFSLVDKNQYPEVLKRHAPRITQFPLISAILHRVQTGFVYASTADGAVFVCAKAGFSQFDTTQSSLSLIERFWHFLQNNNEIPSYIHLYDVPSSLQTFIAGQCDKHWIRRRVQFRNYRRAPLYNYQRLLPPRHRIATIQALGCGVLEQAFKLRFAEKFWDSAEDFLTNGLGVCIVDSDDAPLAICYSCCLVDGIAEIDTLVLPENRGRGFMRIVSEAFFNLAMENGVITHWDTFVSNVASHALAQKFHLSRVREYDLVSVVVRSPL